MSLNEPSVFKLLKFDCTCIAILMQSVTGIEEGGSVVVGVVYAHMGGL